MYGFPSPFLALVLWNASARFAWQNLRLRTPRARVTELGPGPDVKRGINAGRMHVPQPKARENTRGPKKKVSFHAISSFGTYSDVFFVCFVFIHICIMRPARVPRSGCDLCAVCVLATCHNVMPLRCQVTRSSCCISRRRIGHPS